MGTFAASVAANSAKLLETVNGKCYDIAFELFNTVINLTPSPEHPGYFAKGSMVNQWYPLDSATFSSEFTSATSDDGTDSRDRLTENIFGDSFEGKDGVVTMTNNTPYSGQAELYGWPSPKWTGIIGPYRMVALGIQQVAAKYK